MMKGQTISHYKILEKLGEGGMGVVYKAHDINLDRVVALKFLTSHDETEAADLQRFNQEAKAAARLNHPYICTIHNIDEHEGRPFLVMEYVEGTTLDRLIKERNIAPEETLRYAVQIAGALAEAHEAGIVHRDIKPGNIMVDRKGRIKVMDFGLAKLKGTGDITKTGSTVGTTAYMSPEQIQGSEVDHRADIFSFGVVLYLMLTGHKPFRGEHEAAMMYAIVNEEPTPIRKFLPEAPELLERILRQCLAKDPGERYAAADALKKDLSTLQEGGTAFIQTVELPQQGEVPPESGQQKSGKGSTTISMTLPSGKSPLITAAGSILLLIMAGVMIYYLVFTNRTNPLPERIPVAVTDFVNETGAPELDGLSGMLITSLEQSNRLLVMPRSRMFDILDQQGIEEVSYIDESLGKQVARAADLRALVTASIHRFGEVYTIDLKILDVQRDEYLFTVSEQGEGRESIPRMLDRLSEQIREDFQGPDQREEIDSKPVAELTTPNLEAYQYYFKGEELINKLKFEEAEEQFRKAIALDPEFALAYYRLGYARSWLGKEAEKYYAKALEYIDKVPPKEQMMIRAVTVSSREDRIKLLEKVLERYPQEKEALFIQGDNYFHSGQIEESIQNFRKVLEIDPSFQQALQHIVWAYGGLGDKREIEYARKYVEEVPNREAYFLLAGAHYYHGNKREAFDTFRRAQERFPDDAYLEAGTSLLYMIEKQFEKAFEIYRPLVTSEEPMDREVGLLMSSISQLYQGKISRALETLEDMAAYYRERDDLANLKRIYALQFKVAALFYPDKNSMVERYEQRIHNFPPDDIFSQGYANDAYIYLGELDKVRNIGVIPGFDRYLEGLAAYEANEFEVTLDKWERLGKTLGYIRIDDYLYYMANTYLELGRYDEAQKYAGEISGNVLFFYLSTQNMYSHMFWHPRNLYLLGQIHERRGEKERALEYYNRFLDLWKDADEDLFLLNEAKQRVADLRD